MAMKMPPAAAVARLFTDLLGRNVQSKVVAVAKPPVGGQAVAAYVDASGVLTAVGTCDVASGAALGAALVMIPPAVVEDSIKAKQIDRSLTENLYEVLNVFASIFPQNGAPRVVLREVVTDGNLPDDVKAVIAKPGQRLDMDVAVTGYPPGRLTVLAA